MFDLNKEHTSLILPILPDTAGGSRKSCKRVKTHFLILIFIVFFKKIKFLTFKMSDMKEYFWSRIFKKSVAQFVLYWNWIQSVCKIFSRRFPTQVPCCFQCATIVQQLSLKWLLLVGFLDPNHLRLSNSFREFIYETVCSSLRQYLNTSWLLIVACQRFS